MAQMKKNRTIYQGSNECVIKFHPLIENFTPK